MRTLIVATAMLVCAAITPARASFVYTINLGEATSIFDGTVFPESAFSFTAPFIPRLEPIIIDGVIVPGNGFSFIDGQDGVSFDGAMLNTLPIHRVDVFLLEANHVVYADWESFSSTPLSLGSLGGFQLVVPIGRTGDGLALGTFSFGDAVPGIGNRLQVQDARCGDCFNSSALSTRGSVTISLTPEPASIAFVAAGLLGLALVQKRIRSTREL